MRIQVDEDTFYELKIKQNKFILYFGQGFTKPGTIAYVLEDTGDGYLFSDEFLDHCFEIDYGQMEAIKLLSELLPK